VFVVEVEDQTVCECVEPTAAAAEEVVEMDGFDLGKAAEWARKVAQKLEKKGRLVLMDGMFGPSGHFCSRMRVEVVGGWKGGGDVDRHDCAPVEWCVDDNVSSAARCTE
jgi:hypothetical protein